MKRGVRICSVFGQIEGVVANAMAAEGKVRQIPLELIPETARYDAKGRIAHCALVFTPEAEREFDKRVADLRA